MMRNIKFKSHDSRQAQFAAAVRKNVDNYFKEKAISPKGNWKMTLKSAAMLSLYFVPFVLVLFVPMSGWLALPLAFIMGMGKAGIGMSVMHDAAHGSYSRKRWVNELMSANIYLLGSNVFTWKMQHNVLHHTYTNIDGLDGDIAPRGPIRLCEHSPVLKIHKYQYVYAFFLYGLMTLSKMVKDFTQLRFFINVEITNLSVFEYPLAPDALPMAMVTFDQNYKSSNNSSNMKKRQYWQRDGAQWKIIYEGDAS